MRLTSLTGVAGGAVIILVRSAIFISIHRESSCMPREARRTYATARRSRSELYLEKGRSKDSELVKKATRDRSPVVVEVHAHMHVGHAPVMAAGAVLLPSRPGAAAAVCRTYDTYV